MQMDTYLGIGGIRIGGCSYCWLDDGVRGGVTITYLITLCLLCHDLPLQEVIELEVGATLGSLPRTMTQEAILGAYRRWSLDILDSIQGLLSVS